MRSRLLLLPVLALAIACSSADDERSNAPASGPVGPGATELPPWQPAVCDHLEGGLATAGSDPSITLSRAFALTRWFGVASSGPAADNALLKAITDAPQLGEATLHAFATGTGACIVANGKPIADAWVERDGDVAIIHPGNGTVVIPTDARALAVDLRGLASGPALERAVRELVPSLITGDLTWPRADEVRCQGMPDEVFSPGENAYRCRVERNDILPVIHGQAPPRPLAVITGSRVAPEAALMAVSLRLAGKAWLVGENVMTAVAESTAARGPSSTAYVRTHVLSRGEATLPDVVLADHRSADPTQWLRGLAERGEPPLAAASEVTRPTKLDLPALAKPTIPRKDVDAMRAAVIAAHAAVRTFFPYFGAMGDSWDSAFVKALAAAADVTSVRDQRRILGQMGTALEDGHNFVGSQDRAAYPKGYAALALEVVGQDVIVTESGDPAVTRGDRIVAVAGEPVDQRMARAASAISGSPGRRRSSSALSLLAIDGPTLFVLEDALGTTRTVTLSPGANTRVALRPPGPLTDLGAPDTYYVSLDNDDLKGANVAALASAAKQHRALVLDMRGYPGSEGWQLAGRLLPVAAKSCELRLATLNRSGELSRDLQVQDIKDMGGSSTSPFAGPIAMLVGNDTQSSAEHLAFFFKNGKYAKLVGRTSSGANGNITGIHLAGGLSFSFTGMEVRHPGGARFHGIGLLPDIAVEPTRADIASGKDTALLRSIDVVTAP